MNQRKIVLYGLLGILLLCSCSVLEGVYNSDQTTSIYGNQQKRVNHLGGNYSKDNFNVYYEGMIIQKASAPSFYYLGQAMPRILGMFFIKVY